jgi:hypothetical protein
MGSSAAQRVKAFLTMWEFRMAVLGDGGELRKVVTREEDGTKVEYPLTVADLRELVEAVLNPDD